ncbi:MAG: hypothetical protein WCP31_12705, partial [Chloroflexales bacterium]
LYLGRLDYLTYKFYLKGQMDNVTLWTKALSAAEVQATMATISGSEAGLVVFYDFNQATAGGTNSTATTLLDRAGVALNGTLTNFALSSTSSNWVTSTMPITLAPTVTTGVATTGSPGSMLFNATVNANGGTTTVAFQVSTSSGVYTNATVIALPTTVADSSATSVSTGMSGLNWGTTYYYRVVATNSAGTTNGNELSFTTANPLPSVNTRAASDLSSSGAALMAVVNANNVTTTVSFQLTPSSGVYTNATTLAATPASVTGGSATAVSATATDLSPDTLYYYRVVATTSTGTRYGDEKSFMTGPFPGKVRYVKAGGSGDCTSWAKACNLPVALASATHDQAIWAAAGVYQPTTVITATTATFDLRERVALYGGFAGTETALEQRQFVSPTILSGDLAGDDTNTDGNFIAETWADQQGSNSNTVVTCRTWGESVLDGVTITGGNASSDGGGLANTNCKLTLSNVTFSGNQASKRGGGMFSSVDSSLSNVTFSGNQALNSGGGLFNLKASVSLSNVTFNGNRTSNQAQASSYFGCGGGMA